MDYRSFEDGADRGFFWFLAKERLIGALFKKALPHPTADSRVLDVGAGMGEDVPAISAAGRVYAIDVSQNALDAIPDGLVAEKKLCDAGRIGYPDGFFDTAVAFDVLEHIEDDVAAIGEIRRVLKPGGHFVFTVPAFDFIFSAHDKALHHHRRYGMGGLSGKLDGFRRIESGYWMCLLFVPVAMMRLLKSGEKTPRSEGMPLPKWANALLYRIASAETRLIAGGVRLPIGLTIYGIYRKNA